LGSDDVHGAPKAGPDCGGREAAGHRGTRMATLHRLNRAFVYWGLEPAKPPVAGTPGRTVCFFDDTQIEVNGTSFEGLALNYGGF